jgi:hypothetical protein
MDKNGMSLKTLYLLRKVNGLGYRLGLSSLKEKPIKYYEYSYKFSIHILNE